MQFSDIEKIYPGKRIVFVSGNFNIIHPGHLRLLSFARSCGDVLVIGLHTDDGASVMVNYEDRKASLLALEMVDEVLPLDPKSLLICIETLRPYAVVKGREHETLDNPEQKVVDIYGGHLFFSAGEQSFSSRDLIRHEFKSSVTAIRKLSETFLANHSITKDILLSRLNSFPGVQVLVLGDLIIDEYIYCDPLGMSQEDPTIVVTPLETKRFVGAAGIVAGHLAGLGAKVNFVSIVGEDSAAESAVRDLEAMRVKAHFVRDPTRPTTVKQRYRAHGKTLLRVSHLRSHDAAREYYEAALCEVWTHLTQADFVVFSDFNYGCLPQPFVDNVTAECKKNGVRYYADSQASSQVGNVGRFVGADFLSATEREARLATNDFKSGVQNVANTLLSRSQANSLLLKLGAEGLIAVQACSPFFTDSLPAFNSNPVDVAGAGDAMLAAASLARYAGGSIFEAAYLGSIAAAIQVSRAGNLPLTLVDLTDALNNGL